jgi:hypothetical protein
MSNASKATSYRELADLLLKADERAMSLLRDPAEGNEGLLMRLSHNAAADADALLYAANELDPLPFVPDLFQWERGKTAPAVRQ